MNKDLLLRKYARVSHSAVYIPGYRSPAYLWIIILSITFIIALVTIGIIWAVDKSPSIESNLNIDSVAAPSVQVDDTPNYGTLCRVASVIDGDTIRADCGEGEEKVRFIGIDTPETVDPGKPVECYGLEASDFIESKLAGQYVYLVADGLQGDRDRYERLLRYVYTADKENLNELLVRQGYATYERQYPISYRYSQAFDEAESYAKSNSLGLWGQCSI